MKTLTPFRCLLLSTFVAAGCNSSETGPTAPPANSTPITATATTPALPPNHPSLPIMTGTSGALPPGHPNIDMSTQQLPFSAAATADNPKWTVPADWKPGRPSMMRRASFIVTGTDTQTAEISVTVFPGDVGGMTSNVNRWRAQLGLAPVAADKLTSIVTPIKITNTDANIVDISTDAAPDGKTQPQRMVVVVLPHEGNSWFFKMNGDAPIVAAQKDALRKFVESVKF